MGRPKPVPDETQKQPKGGNRVEQAQKSRPAQPPVREIGGPKGPEPTRYGDWERGGRCTDF
jgi:hypothetical protein